MNEYSLKAYHRRVEWKEMERTTRVVKRPSKGLFLSIASERN